MKKLFEPPPPQKKKKATMVGTLDAKIMFAKAPFIQYEQILLDENFRQYLETIMVSEKILCMAVQKAPILNT